SFLGQTTSTPIFFSGCYTPASRPQSIYRHHFLSFYQIQAEFFKNCAKPTVYNRLSKIIKAGFISVLRTNLYAHHLDGRMVSAVYQITKSGIKILQSFFSEKSFGREPLSLNMGSLYHDLVLTDVCKNLENAFENKETAIFQRSRFASEFSEKVPDAVVTDPRNMKTWAVELELSAKSEERYRDIVVSYRLSKIFEKVIYVYQNDDVRNKIGAVITGFGKQYKPSDPTDRFYFVSLNDFLRSHNSAVISNGREQFTSHHREQGVSA
ncbi:hypothetical protein K2X05_14280, partial [bacterium]|nr:hypothetical protein [bacterium]